MNKTYFIVYFSDFFFGRKANCLLLHFGINREKMELGKYSFGIGDRFGCQGKAQLEAIKEASKQGIEITPVWNKSFREHSLVNTIPADTRKEADKVVKDLNWTQPYFVDADHINLSNVSDFIESSDFFTLDVADYIGEKAEIEIINAFIESNREYIGELRVPGIESSFTITQEELEKIAGKFLFAIQEAKKIYDYIIKKKGEGNFIPEISMDEVDLPQTPVELFFILSAISMFGIPVQTIAPKFTGRFNKGVDYAGNIDQFAKEFEEDLLVMDYAIKEFDLPANLKLSVHSGSDKFSIYPVISKLIKKHNKGIHVKTAGTTWLEELIGLALAGGEALELVKSIYSKGLERFEEISAPYSTVIDIDRSKLPDPSEVNQWSGEKLVNSLRHIPDHPEYNPNIRQLLHLSYKIAAEYGDVYLHMLHKYSEIISEEVRENIYGRHIRRLFPEL